MRKQADSPEAWIEDYYRIESDYARKILASSKNSSERDRLFREGYDQITKIIDTYNPGGGETDYSDVVVSLIGKRLGKGSYICDIGCASGNLLYQLALLGYEIEGLDVSEELIQKARVKLGSIGQSESVSQSDIMSYQPRRKFDCVVMDNVIEHFHPDTIDDVLGKSLAMLRENGYIIILTPHRFSGPHDISKHFLPLGSKAAGFHLNEFSFTDLYRHLDQAGFRTVFGFPFHPRLLRKFNLIPDCSKWAAWKAIRLESLFEHTALSRTLKQNASLSRMIVALSFPAVCVAQK